MKTAVHIETYSLSTWIRKTPAAENNASDVKIVSRKNVH